MKGRLRRLMKSSPRRAQNLPTDESDYFVRYKTAHWLLGVLSKYPSVNEETIQIMIWVTYYSKDSAKRWVFEILQGKFEEFLEMRNDPKNRHDDDCELVMEIYNEMTRKEQKNVIPLTIRAIERTIEETANSTNSKLAKSLDNLAETYGLSDAEIDAGLFLALKSEWKSFEQYFDDHLGCDRVGGRKFFQAALGLTASEFQQVINGKLSKIGILDKKHSWLSLDDEFMPMFLDPTEDFKSVDVYKTVSKPGLPIEELDIEPNELSNIESLLSSTDDRPVHILLYGPPGTGKSTFARGIAKQLCRNSVEVMGLNTPSVKRRQIALEACLQMTADDKERIVVVDEADHILSQSISMIVSGNSADKTWINSILERPKSRCIWVVNHSSDIDSAIQRRFTYSLEMGYPKQEIRARIIAKVLRKHSIKRYFSVALIKELSECYAVSPGVFELAASTASLYNSDKLECIRVFRDSLNSKLKLAGIPVPKSTKMQKASIPFMANGLNTSVPYGRLIQMTSRYNRKWDNNYTDLPAMNLLFHGVPGTGKTVLAKQLAEELQRPLIIKRGSDILDKYIGGTEQNIARAFQQAREQEAILLIDEIDSLLANRGDANRTWEVSQVNELLTQMEQGPAILIATTNNIGKMDNASMRRFLSRIKFSPLQGKQVIDVYSQIFRPLVGRARLSKSQKEQLLSMESLTTAELVRIRRRLELLCDETDHKSIFEELASEQEPKQQAVVGFLN